MLALLVPAVAQAGELPAETTLESDSPSLAWPDQYRFEYRLKVRIFLERRF